MSMISKRIVDEKVVHNALNFIEFSFSGEKIAE